MPTMREGWQGDLEKKKKKEFPTIISGSKQSASDPNVIRGDKSGAWKGNKKKLRRLAYYTKGMKKRYTTKKEWPE